MKYGKSGRNNPHLVRVEQAKAREARARSDLARVQSERDAAANRNRELELENQILREEMAAARAVEKAERSLFRDALFFGLLILLPDAAGGFIEYEYPSVNPLFRHSISLGVALALMVLYAGAKKLDHWWASRKEKSHKGQLAGA
jgi:hypothetical protein